MRLFMCCAVIYILYMVAMLAKELTRKIEDE